MRKKSDKVLEGRREREKARERRWGGGAKRGKKDFLTLQLLLRQPA